MKRRRQPDPQALQNNLMQGGQEQEDHWGHPAQNEQYLAEGQSLLSRP